MKCSMQFHPKVKWRREGNAFTCVTLANRIKIALVYNQNFTGSVTFISYGSTLQNGSSDRKAIDK